MNRLELAKLILGEIIHYRANMPVVLSRPCIYGVFSGPVGGFAPRPQKCVGCLRCTVEYPEIVQIHPNPERLRLGDAFFTPDLVDAVLYEAATGRVPVRGAGYRGQFGGPGWDGLWTDMSEIVRPTRDGIHGREFISTSVDVGTKPDFLTFDADGRVAGAKPRCVSLPIPLLFDRPPVAAESETLYRALAAAAAGIQTLAFMPARQALAQGLASRHIAPIITPAELDRLKELPARPRVIELDGWDADAYGALQEAYPDAVVCVRAPLAQPVRPLVEAGARVIHLTANYHGQAGGQFALDAIRAAHEALVAAGLREQTTLIGSGGITAAEHVPKAIICGLDAVALDTALMIALQARFDGECVDGASARMEVPAFPPDWGAQRLMNLAASWRDQLLEIMGAMGIREVRRLRGEMGRAMFQADLEREAFADIEGFAA